MPEFPLVLQRCALVVNDFMQWMVEPTSPAYTPAGAIAIERLLPLLAFCREQGIPTAFGLLPPGAIRIPDPSGRPPDPALYRLADRLGRAPGDLVFVKPLLPSGHLPVSGLWQGTPLDAYLRERGRDTVLVAGATTQWGVDTTIREGANRGYQIVALYDCCVTRPMDDRGWGAVAVESVEPVFFTAWAYWFARLMTAAEALAELRAQVPR
ncbi:MAG TPA: isochorismatase family cysteine hydrolase [Chloroflexota bacterium]|nr:isochorismatase family cysteine hydrolase [Chloroflexota bacterium]